MEIMNPTDTLLNRGPWAPTWLESALEVYGAEEPMESEESATEENTNDHRLGFV